MRCEYDNKNECIVERLQGFKMCPQCVSGKLKFYLNLESKGIPVPSMCNYKQFKNKEGD